MTNKLRAQTGGGGEVADAEGRREGRMFLCGNTKVMHRVRQHEDMDKQLEIVGPEKS